MVKNKFYKNLYQLISFFSVIIIFVFFLLMGFIESINYRSNEGWILLIISILLIALFFVIGGYWIFQKVVINERGIKIVFIKKIIKECLWDEIETIEDVNIMKNPAIRINLLDGSEIHLDRRKSILSVINLYWGNRYSKTI